MFLSTKNLVYEQNKLLENQKIFHDLQNKLNISFQPHQTPFIYSISQIKNNSFENKPISLSKSLNSIFYEDKLNLINIALEKGLFIKINSNFDYSLNSHTFICSEVSKDKNFIFINKENYEQHSNSLINFLHISSYFSPTVILDINVLNENFILFTKMTEDFWTKTEFFDIKSHLYSLKKISDCLELNKYNFSEVLFEINHIEKILNQDKLKISLDNPLWASSELKNSFMFSLNKFFDNYINYIKLLHFNYVISDLEKDKLLTYSSFKNKNFSNTILEIFPESLREEKEAQYFEQLIKNKSIRIYLSMENFFNLYPKSKEIFLNHLYLEQSPFINDEIEFSLLNSKVFPIFKDFFNSKHSLIDYYKSNEKENSDFVTYSLSYRFLSFFYGVKFTSLSKFFQDYKSPNKDFQIKILENSDNLRKYNFEIHIKNQFNKEVIYNFLDSFFISHIDDKSFDRDDLYPKLIKELHLNQVIFSSSKTKNNNNIFNKNKI